jgi:hypothetical protein
MPNNPMVMQYHDIDSKKRRRVEQTANAEDIVQSAESESCHDHNYTLKNGLDSTTALDANTSEVLPMLMKLRQICNATGNLLL